VTSRARWARGDLSRYEGQVTIVGDGAVVEAVLAAVPLVAPEG
jgi:hypothetical protein